MTAHVGRSWINSFGESNAAQEFNEAANACSVRVDYARPTGVQFADRGLDWVIFGGYAGFFGANRDALGFSSVGEIGAGFELPLGGDSGQSSHLRLSAGYLSGPDVRGWSVGLGVRY